MPGHQRRESRASASASASATATSPRRTPRSVSAMGMPEHAASHAAFDVSAAYGRQPSIRGSYTAAGPAASASPAMAPGRPSLLIRQPSQTPSSASRSSSPSGRGRMSLKPPSRSGHSRMPSGESGVSGVSGVSGLSGLDRISNRTSTVQPPLMSPFGPVATPFTRTIQLAYDAASPQEALIGSPSAVRGMGPEYGKYSTDPASRREWETRYTAMLDAVGSTHDEVRLLIKMQRVVAKLAHKHEAKIANDLRLCRGLRALEQKLLQGCETANPIVEMELQDMREVVGLVLDRVLDAKVATLRAQVPLMQREALVHGSDVFRAMLAASDGLLRRYEWLLSERAGLGLVASADDRSAS
ncbi:hypothetical protein BC831DRAFT_449045 [Entophlyctis helioformis]|nr:hypothetical protein BC831DRAFT_449045 [Entophlyctis helioformis]